MLASSAARSPLAARHASVACFAAARSAAIRPATWLVLAAAVVSIAAARWVALKLSDVHSVTAAGSGSRTTTLAGG